MPDAVLAAERVGDGVLALGIDDPSAISDEEVLVIPGGQEDFLFPTAGSGMDHGKRGGMPLVEGAGEIDFPGAADVDVEEDAAGGRFYGRDGGGSGIGGSGEELSGRLACFHGD
jgi:hypothetical protein